MQHAINNILILKNKFSKNFAMGIYELFFTHQKQLKIQ